MLLAINSGCKQCMKADSPTLHNFSLRSNRPLVAGNRPLAQFQYACNVRTCTITSPTKGCTNAKNGDVNIANAKPINSIPTSLVRRTRPHTPHQALHALGYHTMHSIDEATTCVGQACAHQSYSNRMLIPKGTSQTCHPSLAARTALPRGRRGGRGGGGGGGGCNLRMAFAKSIFSPMQTMPNVSKNNGSICLVCSEGCLDGILLGLLFVFSENASISC